MPAGDGGREVLDKAVGRVLGEKMETAGVVVRAGACDSTGPPNTNPPSLYGRPRLDLTKLATPTIHPKSPPPHTYHSRGYTDGRA